MSKLRVFFDGGCPLCSKEIQIYRNADQTDMIDWLDISQPPHSDSLPLPRQTLLARFHVQKPDGELVSGARGFIEVWRHLPKWRWLARICSLPGLPLIMELAYRGFLKVRPTVQRVL